MIYTPRARVLWRLNSGQGPVDLSGAAATSYQAVDARDTCDLGLFVTVAGSATGTTPTLDAQIDALDPDGNVYAQLAKITQLTAAGHGTAYCGLHIGTGLVLPEQVQVTITLGGATPVFHQVSAFLVSR